MVERCQICDWPLAESREKGCVPGDCSYRPEIGSPEWMRISVRRDAIRLGEVAKKLQPLFSSAV